MSYRPFRVAGTGIVMDCSEELKYITVNFFLIY